MFLMFSQNRMSFPLLFRKFGLKVPFSFDTVQLQHFSHQKVSSLIGRCSYSSQKNRCESCLLGSRTNALRLLVSSGWTSWGHPKKGREGFDFYDPSIYSNPNSKKRTQFHSHVKMQVHNHNDLAPYKARKMHHLRLFATRERKNLRG